MDSTQYDRMVDFLTEANLVFLGPAMSPANHRQALKLVIQKLCHELGIQVTAPVATKQPNVQVATRDNKAIHLNGPVESVVSIPSVETKKSNDVKETTPASTPKSSDSGEFITKKSAKDTKTTKVVDNSFDKVYIAENGGWLKALSSIAKQLNENGPRSDPMTINFKIKNTDKPFKVKFWLEDVKEFGKLWDEYGDKIKREYDMDDDEYNGIVMMKSVVWYGKQNPHPAYTRVATRARMFAQCIGKCDNCMTTTMLDIDSYKRGDRAWSDAYRFDNRLCQVCNDYERNKQQNGDYDEEDAE